MSFACHSAAFQYIQILFELRNAPETFQLALDLIRSRYNCKTCIVYMDNIIIISRDMEENLDHRDNF